MDINAVAKKIRQAVMDSAEDQGRTFNASILDEVIAKELRLSLPAPTAPAAYPWPVVPMTDNKVTVVPAGSILDMVSIGSGLFRLSHIDTDEWR